MCTLRVIGAQQCVYNESVFLSFFTVSYVLFLKTEIMIV